MFALAVVRSSRRRPSAVAPLLWAAAFAGAGQPMSFALVGPTGPSTVSAIVGVHLKQFA